MMGRGNRTSVDSRKQQQVRYADDSGSLSLSFVLGGSARVTVGARPFSYSFILHTQFSSGGGLRGVPYRAADLQRSRVPNRWISSKPETSEVEKKSSRETVGKKEKKNRTLVEDGVGSVDVFSLLVGLDDTGNTLCKSRRRQRWLDAAYKKVSLNP